MKQRIGVAGFVIGAAFALATVAASAAQAAEFTSTGYPAMLEGQPGGASTIFTFAENQTECAETGLHGVLGEASSVLEIERFYAGCTTTIGGVKYAATILDNECKFKLTIAEEIVEGTYTATVDIVCPGGKELEIRVYKNALAHIFNIPMCTYTVGAQQNLVGVRLTNLKGPPKTIEVAPTVEETIAYGIVGGGECGEAEAEFDNGSYTGITEMVGYLCCTSEPVDLAVK